MIAYLDLVKKKHWLGVRNGIAKNAKIMLQL